MTITISDTYEYIMKKIWITRPRADSETLANALQRPTLIAPVMRISALHSGSFGDKPAALMFTSRHALMISLPVEWKLLPAYCVGEATARAASDAGYSHVIDGGGDAMALAQTVASRIQPGNNILYPCGEETRIDMTTLLAARQIQVRPLICYRAIAEDSLPTPVIDALDQHAIGGVALFSPRSASLVCELMQHAGYSDAAKAIDAYCLSINVASAAGALPFRSIHVAASPTNQSMVALIHGF